MQTRLSPLLSVRATEKSLETALRRQPGKIAIQGVGVWEATGATLWQGTARGQRVSLPRFDERGRDRSALRFQAVNERQEAVGAAQWVTEFTGHTVRTHPLPLPKSIKGVQCVVDRDDAMALGVKHVGVNLAIREWLLPPPNAPQEGITVDGERIPLHAVAVARMDEQVKAYTQAGISVTFILLNTFPRDARPDDALVHPQTDREGAPNAIGAFNLSNENSVRLYRALLTFLAQRYTDPAEPHGRIHGFIIGNEVQSHWHWYNIGKSTPEAVIREYHNALRLAWLSVRSVHRELRVYTSTDYYWTRSHGGRDQTLPGKQLLEGLVQTSKATGDFDWFLAHHPYPQGLFDPVFWDDDDAPLAMDAPIVNFRNLEVLTNWLRRPAFQYQRPGTKTHTTRRLILSEQGFHCVNEPLQAAAYAYAYHKVRHLPEVDAFILHRHVDHRNEGGLKLGLWSARTDTADPSAPDKKRRLWHTLQKADTPEWEAAFAFALPLCGLKNWSEALPFTGKIPEKSPPPKPLYPGKVIADLIALRDSATTRNVLDWRRTNNALFQHPPARGDGDAIFSLTLPKLPRLALLFSVQNSATQPAPNGIRFAVLADNTELWTTTVTDNGNPQAHTIDLTPYAGKTITLTLRVNARGNSSNAWANWLAPAVVQRKR